MQPPRLYDPAAPSHSAHSVYNFYPINDVENFFLPPLQQLTQGMGRREPERGC